eukprot:scaffold34054_cov72-Phaeocystis_antarctica.AAC.2
MMLTDVEPKIWLRKSEAASRGGGGHQPRRVLSHAAVENEAKPGSGLASGIEPRRRGLDLIEEHGWLNLRRRAVRGDGRPIGANRAVRRVIERAPLAGRAIKKEGGVARGRYPLRAAKHADELHHHRLCNSLVGLLQVELGLDAGEHGAEHVRFIRRAAHRVVLWQRTARTDRGRELVQKATGLAGLSSKQGRYRHEAGALLVRHRLEHLSTRALTHLHDVDAEKVLYAPCKATIRRGAKLADDNLEGFAGVVDLVEFALLCVHPVERRVQQGRGKRRRIGRGWQGHDVRAEVLELPQHLHCHVEKVAQMLVLGVAGAVVHVEAGQLAIDTRFHAVVAVALPLLRGLAPIRRKLSSCVWRHALRQRGHLGAHTRGERVRRHGAAHERRVDLDWLTKDGKLAALQCSGGRGGADEAAERVQRKAVRRETSAALLELGALTVELDAASSDLAELQQCLCDLCLGSLGRHAHQHHSERADAPLRLLHWTEELGARPWRVAAIALLPEGKVDVCAVGAFPVARGGSRAAPACTATGAAGEDPGDAVRRWHVGPMRRLALCRGLLTGIAPWGRCLGAAADGAGFGALARLGPPVAGCCPARAAREGNAKRLRARAG